LATEENVVLKRVLGVLGSIRTWGLLFALVSTGVNATDTTRHDPSQTIILTRPPISTIDGLRETAMQIADLQARIEVLESQVRALRQK